MNVKTSPADKTIQVEKGVPLPRPKRQVYPFATLQVATGDDGDDSFFVPAKDAAELRRVQFRLNSAASKAASRLNAKLAPERPIRFTVRRVEGGVRVWRVQ